MQYHRGLLSLKNRHSSLVSVLVGIVTSASLLLSACSPVSPVNQTPPTKIQPTHTATLPPTQTPEPPRILTICSMEEPSSLYLYDGSSAVSKWNVLAAIYEGLPDLPGGQPQPTILRALPSGENGLLYLQPVSVTAGQEIVDANGELRVLQMGVEVRPAGCRESACAIAWDGETPLQMDSLTLKFEFQPGTYWSDGTQLTAQDSIFSYQLAKNVNTPTSKWAVDRTSSYTALDDQTVEWVGIPGFTTPNLSQVFWSPLPLHAWSALSPVDLLTADVSSRQPIGWGAYHLSEWQPGDSITLVRNSFYYRAAEGLPFYDVLIFRYLKDKDRALDDLRSGACDILDSTFGFESNFDVISELAQQDVLRYQIIPTYDWASLTFGIKPASYDNGYIQLYGDRPDFFSDIRVRQAVVHCVDRQAIAAPLIDGSLQVPASLLPSGSPSEWSAYDPVAGNRLLDEVGWLDIDEDPLTPRVAWRVAGVSMGTPFSLTLLSGRSAFDQQAAQKIVSGLDQCGIQVVHTSLSLDELYAPGPEGVLFGRQFHLALLSWENPGVQSCQLYASENIPSEVNYWIGGNIAGFANAEYDTACRDSILALPGELQSHALLNQIWAEQLPALPLVYHPRVLLFRPELNIPALYQGAISDFLGIEELTSSGFAE